MEEGLRVAFAIYVMRNLGSGLLPYLLEEAMLHSPNTSLLPPKTSTVTNMSSQKVRRYRRTADVWL